MLGSRRLKPTTSVRPRAADILTVCVERHVRQAAWVGKPAIPDKTPQVLPGVTNEREQIQADREVSAIDAARIPWRG